MRAIVFPVCGATMTLIAPNNDGIATGAASFDSFAAEDGVTPARKRGHLTSPRHSCERTILLLSCPGILSTQSVQPSWAAGGDRGSAGHVPYDTGGRGQIPRLRAEHGECARAPGHVPSTGVPASRSPARVL